MPTNIYVCPHCGRGWPPQWKARHIAACPRDPAVLQRLRAFLEDPDAPGHARSQPWYDQTAPAHGGLPERKALTAEYGDWGAVCRAVGLLPGQRRGFRRGSRKGSAAIEAAAIAETEEALQRDAELREYWSGNRGLTVSDTPRELPDGRLAWMVR